MLQKKLEETGHVCQLIIRMGTTMAQLGRAIFM